MQLLIIKLPPRRTPDLRLDTCLPAVYRQL